MMEGRDSPPPNTHSPMNPSETQSETNKYTPSANTDRELWRKSPNAFAPNIFETMGGGIGINVGGYVIIAPVEKWHAALKSHELSVGMTDTQILDWICEHPSELGIKSDYSMSNKHGVVGEYTDIRKKVKSIIDGDE